MILKKRHIFFLLLPLICCNTQLAVSQEIPPQAKAGAADRKLEKPEPLIFDKGPKKLMLPRDKRILVKKFVVEKNGIISEERLDNLFAPYLNKELDLHKLEWVCDLVSIEYHEKGYFLARAVLPEQEIKDGVVRIVILDGTITTKDIGEFESEPELEYKPKRRSTYKPKASAKPKRKSIGAKQDKPKPKLKPRPKPKRRPKPRLAAKPKVSARAKRKGIEKTVATDRVRSITDPVRDTVQPIFDKPPKKLKLPKEKRILVKEFIVEKNEILSEVFLNDLFAPYINKELTLNKLKWVCELISMEYHERGYFAAKAVLPTQEIKDGIVKIVVLDGTINIAVEVVGENNYKEDFIKKNFHATKDGAIHRPTIVKSLLLLNENQDLDVRASLGRSAKSGTTNIVLEVEDRIPIDLSIDYNNFGSRYTAKHRMGLDLDVGNVGIQGSKLSTRAVMGIGGESLWFAKGGYEVPFGTYGTRLGLAYLWSDFDVGKDYKALDTSGNSSIYSADITHPVIRTTATSLDANFGFDYKDIENHMLDSLYSNDELGVLRGKVNFSHLDFLNGRSMLSPALSFGMAGADSLASRAGVPDAFLKFSTEFARIQKLPKSCFLILRTSAQISSDTLPVCEQFYIGGGNSVRGFPLAEHLGDWGYFGSLELRTPMPMFLGGLKMPLTKWGKVGEHVQFAAFVDYGKTFLRSAEVGEKNESDIAGIGCGLRLNAYGFDSINLDWAFRIGGEEPSDGNNSVFYISARKEIW